VCDQIMGNCLCVLGDAMAMPVASMIKHFRAEFEEYMEAARERAGLGLAIPQVNRGRQAGPQPMREPAGVDPVPVSY
jgi:NADH-quinone oxidoreductase subunit F